MAKQNQSSNKGQRSVKIRAKPLKGPSCQVADFALEGDACILPSDNKHAEKKATHQSYEKLSTTELISVVGRIWDSASSSLSRLQPKASINRSQSVSQKDSQACYFFESENFGILDVVVRSLHVDLNSSRKFPTIVQRSLESLRPPHKITYIPCDDHFIQNQFLRNVHDSSVKHGMCSKETSLANAGILSSLANNYGWMSQISQWPDLPLPIFKKIIESSFSRASVPSYSEHCLQTVEDTLSAADVSTASSLGLHGNYDVSVSPSGCTSEPIHEIEDKGILENKMQQSEKSDMEVELQSESYSSVTNKPHPLLAKQEHAVSGALAGIFVSLCLHPIDTVKTVVQSCRAGGQNSICFIGQSIVSERGLSGLYRGISSNITTSAPISAIYTFTYESVKGLLLPSLSKEYHSVAHCTAGACASIATSFIFTPSERIKQQMQVNSQYRNCWNAVFRITEKGGLLSLYTGWGAVLCRNIPHSIIKFYTYESLKQVFVSSQPSKQPTTLQTLLCGGIAGSTAALVSTPFDVVKTRFQTQVPGSARRYHNILNALKEIREHEGVRGLYRGLIPRLVMYMSQGALFFASYEFFKSIVSLQLSQHKTETLQHQQDADDDPRIPL